MVDHHQEQPPPSPEPCALEEALSGAGIGAFDAAGVVRGGWESLMAAPMGGGSLDAPGGVPAEGGVGLGGGYGDEDEESGLAMAMGGGEVRCVALRCNCVITDCSAAVCPWLLRGFICFVFLVCRCCVAWFLWLHLFCDFLRSPCSKMQSGISC